MLSLTAVPLNMLNRKLAHCECKRSITIIILFHCVVTALCIFVVCKNIRFLFSPSAVIVTLKAQLTLLWPGGKHHFWSVLKFSIIPYNFVHKSNCIF